MHRRKVKPERLLIAPGNDDTSNNDKSNVAFGRQRNNGRTMKRLRRRQRTTTLFIPNSIWDYICTTILLVLFATLIFGMAFVLVFLCTWVMDPHNPLFYGRRFHHQKLIYQDLYDQIYNNNFTERNESFSVQSKNVFSGTYSDEIMQRKQKVFNDFPPFLLLLFLIYFLFGWREGDVILQF